MGAKHCLAAGVRCGYLLRFGLGAIRVLQGLVGWEQEFGDQGELLPEGVGVGAGAAVGAQGGELLAQGAVGYLKFAFGQAGQLFKQSGGFISGPGEGGFEIGFDLAGAEAAAVGAEGGDIAVDGVNGFEQGEAAGQ